MRGGAVPRTLPRRSHGLARRGVAPLGGGPVRWLRPLAVLAGALIVIWLVWEIGISTLVNELRKLSWRLPLILLPQVVTNLFKTEAWRLAFPRRRPTFRLLFPVRLAGEAVNESTPTATMGGDALKAYLLVRAGAGVPVEEGFVSIVVAKTALVASLAAFIGVRVRPRLGVRRRVLVHAHSAGRPVRVHGRVDLRASCGPSAGGCSGWVAVLSSGSDWAIGSRWAPSGSMPTCGGTTGSGGAQAAAVFGLSLVGWATGALETWLMLFLLESPVSLLTALIIEGGATGVRAVGFLIPGSIGVLEGGLVGIFAMLGLGSGTGLAFGIARRFREGAWILAGYVCLAVMRGPKTPAPVGPEITEPPPDGPRESIRSA